MSNKRPKTRSMRAFDKALGAHIRSIRENRNITRDKLSSAIHCTLQRLSRYEAGDTSIPAQMLVRIAGAFGCSVDEIVAGVKA